MRIFKNREFNKWAAQEGLNSNVLRAAVDEMECSLIDANLGGHVFKKRVAIAGRDKSSGARTLLVYKARHRVFFVYGFTKNKRVNINESILVQKN